MTTETTDFTVIDKLTDAIDTVCNDCARTLEDNACVTGDRDDCPLIMVAVSRAEAMNSQPVRRQLSEEEYEVARDAYTDSLTGVTEYGTLASAQIEIAWQLKQIVDALRRPAGHK